MTKQKQTLRKKYDPSRTRQRLMGGVLSTTFFYHGSMIDSHGALCGNFKYPLDDAIAKAILNRRNTWAGVVIAFASNGKEDYLKCSEVFSLSQPMNKYQLDEFLTRVQMRLVESMNLNHVCSTGYFIVPDHLVDIESQLEAIKQLFEQHNPYDYTLTVLAGMKREQQALKAAV